MKNITKAACLSFCVCFWLNYANAQGADATTSLNNTIWRIDISQTTGGITRISNTADTTKMNFVHNNYTWGILILNSSPKVTFNKPVWVKQLNDSVVETLYNTNGLMLLVKRVINVKGEFHETYTLTNTSATTFEFPAGKIDLAVPFNDTYNGGAPVCLEQNCNTHIWAGGASSWVNAERMNGVASHLGFVLTQGSLSSYSILGASSNDRGKISFNPAAFTLQPGENRTLSWTMFWHTGWADFWTKALTGPQLVQLKVDHHTVIQGDNINITATSTQSLSNAVLRLNGKIIQCKHAGKILTATVKTATVGEQVFELDNNRQKSVLRANVIIDPMALIKARVEFIINKQQRIAPGTPLDGAYVCWDNDEEKQVVLEGFQINSNEARERVGMGVLLALYLPHCNDFVLKEKIVASLDRFKNFIAREIQDSNGVVYSGSHYFDNTRYYNNPWVGHFHLAMYQATKDTNYLALFTKTVKAFYGKNKGVGIKEYPIGLQVMDGLNALKEAGMTADYTEVKKCFVNHANSIEAIGVNYPKSEVNYEQSIVAPGVQIELEAYFITKDSKYLASAKQQLVLLECFNGQQPDYHLNDLAIRHWDDFWFGKLQKYGDTFPHYWSTISAIAFDEYAMAVGNNAYHTRAVDILMNNMCQFTPQGRASCAYLYPLMISNGKGQRFDHRANDQDWALVNWLTVLNRNNVFTESKNITATTYNVSSDLQVKKITKLSSILSPNPARDFAEVIFQNNDGEVYIQLFDRYANKLWQSQKSHFNTVQVPIANLKTGTYIIVVKDNSETQTLQLLKAE